MNASTAARERGCPMSADAHERGWVGAGTMQTRDQCTFFLLFVRWSKTGREKMCKQGKNVQTRTKSGDSRPPKKETDKIKKPPPGIRTRLTERPPGPEWRWPTLPEYRRGCATGIGNPSEVLFSVQ